MRGFLRRMVCLCIGHMPLRLTAMNREPLMTVFGVDDDEAVLVVELCANCGALYWRPLTPKEQEEAASAHPMTVVIEEEAWQRPPTA